MGFELPIAKGLLIYRSRCPSSHFHIGFEFLRCWGLLHVWCMHNILVFETQLGVQRRIRQLKCKSLWQFSLLETSWKLSLEEVQVCELVRYHIRLLGWLLKPYIIWIEIPMLYVFQFSIVVYKFCYCKEKSSKYIFSFISLYLFLTSLEPKPFVSSLINY